MKLNLHEYDPEFVAETIKKYIADDDTYYLAWLLRDCLNLDLVGPWTPWPDFIDKYIHQRPTVHFVRFSRDKDNQPVVAAEVYAISMGGQPCPDCNKKDGKPGVFRDKPGERTIVRMEDIVRGRESWSDKSTVCETCKGKGVVNAKGVAWEWIAGDGESFEHFTGEGKLIPAKGVEQFQSRAMKMADRVLKLRYCTLVNSTDVPEQP